MRKGKGIAGATLLFGPNDPPPDLVAAMQFLVDDLRADGHRISGLRLGARSLRLRADHFELALTLADTPLPERAMMQLFRPSLSLSDDETPDFSRVHLLRGLRGHSHALGFLVRRRGPVPLDEVEAALELVRKSRMCLLPVIEAAPPGLLIWQPGSLLFSLPEFMKSEAEILLRTAQPEQRLLLSGPLRASVSRPETGSRPKRTPPASRSQRADLRSGGRVFGTHQPLRPKVLSRFDGVDDKVISALREPQVPPPRRRRLGLFAAVAVLGVFVPQVLRVWLSA